MKNFLDRLVPIAGGMFGSMKSLNGYFLTHVPNISLSPSPEDMVMPELLQAFLFGFIGGLAGWAAKKIGDSIILLAKKVTVSRISKRNRNEKTN